MLLNSPPVSVSFELPVLLFLSTAVTRVAVAVLFTGTAVVEFDVTSNSFVVASTAISVALLNSNAVVELSGTNSAVLSGGIGVVEFEVSYFLAQ